MCTISRDIQFYHLFVSLSCAIKIPALLTKTRIVLFLKKEIADFLCLTIQKIQKKSRLILHVFRTFIKVFLKY